MADGTHSPTLKRWPVVFAYWLSSFVWAKMSRKSCAVVNSSLSVSGEVARSRLAPRWQDAVLQGVLAVHPSAAISTVQFLVQPEFREESFLGLSTQSAVNRLG